jgi:hypothetical protein
VYNEYLMRDPLVNDTDRLSTKKNDESNGGLHKFMTSLAPGHSLQETI